MRRKEVAKIFFTILTEQKQLKLFQLSIFFCLGGTVPALPHPHLKLPGLVRKQELLTSDPKDST